MLSFLTEPMKKNLLILSAMFSAATTLLAQGSIKAPSPTKTHGQPNVIECVSDDSTVKLSALIGSSKPLRVAISEKDTSGNWNSLDLGGLSVTNTSIGQLLSGYNDRMADATHAYTLIVPNVVVELGSEKVQKL